MAPSSICNHQTSHDSESHRQSVRPMRTVCHGQFHGTPCALSIRALDRPHASASLPPGCTPATERPLGSTQPQTSSHGIAAPAAGLRKTFTWRSPQKGALSSATAFNKKPLSCGDRRLGLLACQRHDQAPPKSGHSCDARNVSASRYYAAYVHKCPH